MLKNIGLASFVVGIVVLGLTAISVMGMESDIERLKDARVELDKLRETQKNAHEGLLWRVQFMQENEGREPTEFDKANPFALSSDVARLEQMGNLHVEISALERKHEKLTRRFSIYVLFGLFLCIVQAPFFVFAGRQN